jgi:H+/Cl- antiporter ClcA
MNADNRWRGIITIILLALAAIVVAVALLNIATPPVMDSKGNVVMEPFENAMLVLTPVLAAATLALGYWFGASGKEKAEAGKEEAQATAAEAKKVVAQLSSEVDESKVEPLRQQYRRAF